MKRARSSESMVPSVRFSISHRLSVAPGAAMVDSVTLWCERKAPLMKMRRKNKWAEPTEALATGAVQSGLIHAIFIIKRK